MLHQAETIVEILCCRIESDGPRLALGVKRATGRGAFVGLIAGIAAVAYVATQMPRIAFLWHNVVGVVVVVIVGVIVSSSHRHD